MGWSMIISNRRENKRGAGRRGWHEHELLRKQMISLPPRRPAMISSTFKQAMLIIAFVQISSLTKLSFLLLSMPILSFNFSYAIFL
jgi:hypothetical protein